MCIGKSGKQTTCKQVNMLRAYRILFRSGIKPYHSSGAVYSFTVHACWIDVTQMNSAVTIAIHGQTTFTSGKRFRRIESLYLKCRGAFILTFAME